MLEYLQLDRVPSPMAWVYDKDPQQPILYVSVDRSITFLSEGSLIHVPKLELTEDQLEILLEEALYQKSLLSPLIPEEEVGEYFKSLDLSIKTVTSIRGQVFALPDPEYLGIYSEDEFRRLRNFTLYGQVVRVGTQAVPVELATTPITTCWERLRAC